METRNKSAAGFMAIIFVMLVSALALAGRSQAQARKPLAFELTPTEAGAVAFVERQSQDAVAKVAEEAHARLVREGRIRSGDRVFYRIIQDGQQQRPCWLAIAPEGETVAAPTSTAAPSSGT